MSFYKQITISKELKEQNFNVISYSFSLNSNNSKADFDKLFNDTKKQILDNYKIEDVINIDMTKQNRDGFKRLHLDPSKNRLACESLIRRIVKGYDLPSINLLVDIGNVLSLKTFNSVCICDYDKLVDDVYIRKGKDNELFESMNRGIINASKMPIYQDKVKNFGTMVTDCKETMITNSTKNCFIMISSFSKEHIEENEEVLLELLNEYLDIDKIEKNVVIYED